jgi:hypothetical protein
MSIRRITLLIVMVFSTAIVRAQTQLVDTAVTLKLDEEASFPGGESAWREFLGQNLDPLVPVKNGAPIGKYTVYVQFVVAKDGSLSDVKALTRMGYGMEQEVMKLIRKSGSWKPAIMDKQPVNAYRKQPVTFQVTQEDFEVSTEVPYVLFAGTDNEISIDAGKIKSQDLRVTISKGSIRPTGDGKFIVNVKVPGRVVLQVFGKKDKKIADVSFEVRER